jgi:molybdopterin synthase sulfur carrier subunit
MSSRTVSTAVLFFGRPSERLGKTRNAEIPAEGCTVAELRARLCEADPLAAPALDRPDVRAAVDQVISSDQARVRPGQEIAFFSVFSGG